MSSLIMNFFNSDFGHSGAVINPDTLVNSDYKIKLVTNPSQTYWIVDTATSKSIAGSSYPTTVGALGETGRVISALNYNTFNEIPAKFITSHTEPEFTVSFWVLTSIANSAIVWGGAKFYVVLFYGENDYPYIINSSLNYVDKIDKYSCYLKNPDYTGKVKKNDWNWVCLTKKDGIGRFWVNGDFQGKFNWPTYTIGGNNGVTPLCGNKTNANNERVYFDDYCVLNKALYTVDKNIPVPTQYFPWNE